MKTCFKCLCVKPLAEFYKHAQMGDGHLNKCKECTKRDVAKRALEKWEYVRQYDRLRGSMPHRVAARKEYAKTKAYAESHAASSKKWMAKHPERKRASTAVGNALRDGRLQKLPCLICGGVDVDGHHPDYSRPLDVVWLCRTHHSEAHEIVRTSKPAPTPSTYRKHIMTVSLYKAAADVQKQISLCVDEDGILDTDRLDMIEATFHDRAVAVVAVFKGKGHTIATLQNYLAEIEKQIKREETNQARLKDYLQACMLMTGTESIKSDDGLLTATLYRDRDESVELDEGAEFPAALCNDPKPPAPSKTLIKQAILSGFPVAGARIVRKDRLTIK